MIEVNSFSAKGKRENNEDFILNRQLSPDCSLFLVADGMGGYSYGEVASSMACESIAKNFTTNYRDSEIKQLISDSLSVANNKLKERRIELSAKMGTTIAGVVIEGTMAYLFWLGDVRIYHFRNEEILFQSEDHSLINEMRKQGDVSAKEIERYGNIVTRSLPCVSMEEEQVIFELPLLPGDVLILCTDGFWQNVNVPLISNLSLEEIQDQVNNQEEVMEDNYSFMRISIGK